MDASNIILNLRRDNEILRRENEQFRALFLRYTMERAIGDDHLSQELAKDMSRFYAGPLSPRYVCILFHGSNAAGSSPVQTAPIVSVSSAYRDTLSRFGQTFFFETIGTVCCLLNIRPALDGVDSDRLLDEILQQLSAAAGPLRAVSGVARISMSRVTNMEQGPRMLYRSASFAYESRTSSSPAVCAADQIRPPAGNSADLMTLEPLFWKQISQQQFFAAATTLDQLIERYNAERLPLEQTLGAVFARLEAVLQITIHAGADPRGQDDFTKLLSNLSQSKTFYEMRTTAYDMLATLEDCFYTPSDVRNKKMPAIERYIHDHYSDPAIGTAAISEEFKISTSYLARIFKADMGMSVTDYIHMVRAEAVKELLGTTSLTLDEIARQVGFSNRWVLSRVFKNTVGITPGQYKEMEQ